MAYAQPDVSDHTVLVCTSSGQIRLTAEEAFVVGMQLGYIVNQAAEASIHGVAWHAWKPLADFVTGPLPAEAVGAGK